MTEFKETLPLLKYGILSVVFLFFALYIGSYVVISRNGFETTKKVLKIDIGFFYADPEHKFDEHETLYYLYFPANKVDCWLGTGRPALRFAPMFKLSK